MSPSSSTPIPTHRHPSRNSVPSIYTITAQGKTLQVQEVAHGLFPCPAPDCEGLFDLKQLQDHLSHDTHTTWLSTLQAGEASSGPQRGRPSKRDTSPQPYDALGLPSVHASRRVSLISARHHTRSISSPSPLRASTVFVSNPPEPRDPAPLTLPSSLRTVTRDPPHRCRGTEPVASTTPQDSLLLQTHWTSTT